MYAACLIIANLTIQNMTNNWTGWGELLMAAQIYSYFVIVAVQAEME